MLILKSQEFVVLFDWDRTLANNEDEWLYYLDYMVEKMQEIHGIDNDWTPEKVLDILHKTREDIMEGLFGPEHSEQALEILREHALECPNAPELHEYAKELLDFLSQTALATGIVSNKSADYLKIQIDGSDAAGYPDVIVGIDDGLSPKPSPDMIEKALDDLGVDTDMKVLFVGDSIADFQGAKAVTKYTNVIPAIYSDVGLEAIMESMDENELKQLKGLSEQGDEKTFLYAKDFKTLLSILQRGVELGSPEFAAPSATSLSRQ